MSFEEQFAETYRETRKHIEAGHVNEAVAGCINLSSLCEKRYSVKNTDKIKTKAVLRYYSGEFIKFANTIQNKGFDNNIKAFFGIKKEIHLSDALVNIPESSEGKIPADRSGSISVHTDRNKNQKITGVNVLPQEDFGNSSVEEKELLESSIRKASAFDPETLDSFTGQEEIVKRIKAEIKAAGKRGLKYIDHILLFGNRGLGKSTLMKLIAKELGVRFEYLDCTQFRSDISSQRAFQSFFQRISKENEPVVIGMDEIHKLPRKLQSGLLTLLNERNFIYMDNNGINHVAPIDSFTFIGATTDTQDVLSTLKDRCSNLTFYLKDYTRNELQCILLNKFSSKQLQIDDDALMECINRCRSSLREVNSIVRGLDTCAINVDTRLIDKAMTIDYFNNAGIDPIGLKEKDLEILNAMYNDESGIMSEDTISAKVNLDIKVYNSEYEPYLIKIGFISITGRGRMLTKKARGYIEKSEYYTDNSESPNEKDIEISDSADELNL